MNNSDGAIKKIFLDINSNGKRIETKVGGEIQIELQGIGSTGYSWYFDQLDHDLFELISEERKEVKQERNDRTGSPLQYIWKFKAKKPGAGKIRMDYYRIWEGKEKATQLFEVIVTVHL